MNALDPAGRGAEAIADLWWVMFVLSLIPLAIVLVALARIILRRRREPPGAERPAPAPGDERGDRRIILLGGVALPVLLLLPVAAMTIATTSAREAGGRALEIEVTAHQFWWDLRYPAPGSARLADGDTFRTANELHVPVGRPVELVVRSDDVVHSLWVPQVDGKIDTIPGRVNRLRIRANRPGVFEGRCAELCGEGHTDMRLLLIAHDEEDFRDWHEREAAPQEISVEAGLRDDFANSCGVCHHVRGLFESESFVGDFGPDLTHLAARRHIGAGAMSNTRESLARWIVDPQGAKPGNRMPDTNVDDGEELGDILDFLERLR